MQKFLEAILRKILRLALLAVIVVFLLLVAGWILWSGMTKRTMSKEKSLQILTTEIHDTLKLNWFDGFTNLNLSSYQSHLRDDREVCFQLLKTDRNGIKNFLSTLDHAKITYGEMKNGPAASDSPDWWKLENYDSSTVFMVSTNQNFKTTLLMGNIVSNPTNQLVFLRLEVHQ